MSDFGKSLVLTNLPDLSTKRPAFWLYPCIFERADISLTRPTASAVAAAATTELIARLALSICFSGVGETCDTLSASSILPSPLRSSVGSGP